MEEYHIKSATHLTTLKCISSEGVIYQVNKEFFRKIKGEDVIKMLSSMAKDKFNFLNKRMQ